MHYMEVTPELTIGELITSGWYGQYANYFFTDMTPDHWNRTLSSYGYEAIGAAPTLRRLEELAAEGYDKPIPIYSELERMQEWDKRSVCMHYFPPRQHKESAPFGLIIPGGGFNRQWALIEGMAEAVRLSDSGYAAFVLYYRVKQEPLMPRPIEDMYQAIRYIIDHAEQFHIDPAGYLIGGFSAGATLSSYIMTENYGCKWAGIPAPALVFQGYTAVMMDLFYDNYDAVPMDDPGKADAGAFLRRIGGPLFTKDSLAPYNSLTHLLPDCPPVYLTANEDDPTVPFINTIMMERRLTEMGIPHRIRTGKTGGHSYGLGIGMEVDGWFDEMVGYWTELRKS